MDGAPVYKYVATEEDLKSLTPDDVALRLHIKEALEGQPVAEGDARCFHCTDMKGGFNIIASGLRPSEQYNTQLQRYNHKAGAFVTKLSPLDFGFPAHGWKERLLSNNYGEKIEGEQPGNSWVVNRSEVCLVLDLPDFMLKDAAEEDPAYRSEGRNVFYIPKKAFDLFGRKELPPQSIALAFRTTRDLPTPEDANILSKRLGEAVAEDKFSEVHWLLHLTFPADVAKREFEVMWSVWSKKAVQKLRPYWSEKALQRVQEALLNRAVKLKLACTDCHWIGDEMCAVASLMETLQRSSALRELDLRIRLSHLGAAALGEALVHNSSLQQLAVASTDMGLEGVVAPLGKALQCNSSLKSLILSFTHVGDEGAVAISQALKLNTSLHQLNLCNTGIDPEGGVALGEALKCNASLRGLDLELNRIGDKGAVALGGALQCNASLQELDLCWNEIRKEGALVLGQMLKYNCSLKWLNLYHNSIGDNGTSALGEALKRNTSLQWLYLSKNNISVEGTSVLGEALKVNTSLRELDLHHNSMGKEGAVALGEALKRNTSLQELDLGFNGIGNEGAVELGEALKCNTSLQRLQLSGNRISDSCAVALREAHGNRLGDMGEPSVLSIGPSDRQEVTKELLRSGRR